MNLKKSILVLIIILVVISLVGTVSAGGFDFLFGSDSDENPIIAPDNAEKVIVEDDNDIEITYGETTYQSNVHSTAVSGETKYDRLEITGMISITYDKLPEDTKSFLEDNLIEYGIGIDAPEIYTNPSNETGSMYLELFDKNNNTILTKNMIVSSDSLEAHKTPSYYYEPTIGSDYSDLMVTEEGLECVIEYLWYFDAGNNQEMVDTLRNADHGEIHYFINSDEPYDFCIPVDVEKNFQK